MFECLSHCISIFHCFLSWLPEHVTLLARFSGEPSPVKSTVTKAVAEFRRTHADTWNIQKDSFTEEQLEVCVLTKLNLYIQIFIHRFWFSNFPQFVYAGSGRYVFIVIVFCMIHHVIHRKEKPYSCTAID